MVNKAKSVLYAIAFFCLLPIHLTLSGVRGLMMIVWLIGMAIRGTKGIKNTFTNWCLDCMLSEDQTFQTEWQLFLNCAPNLSHKFGDEDETASSVIGRNLLANNGLEWRIIEFVLSWVLEGGKPHSIPAIED